MGVRLLHTADWQLGLKLTYLAGEAGAAARLQRFETVRRLGALAHEHEVDAVLVAGDVFDDNAVGADTIQRAADALATFAPIPVLLLPGNHDPATADSALVRMQAGAHVHVCTTPEPVTLDGVTIYPCPVQRRHEPRDPTAGLAAREDDDTIRVALAHGGVLDFGEETESPRVIDVAALVQKGFDYIALGDWHGTWTATPRAWYAGTPEPTGFKANDAGNALLVDLDEPGVEPAVERLAVARLRWLRKSCRLEHDDDLDAFADWFEALPEKAHTLLRLELEGTLSLAAGGRLEALLDDIRSRCIYLRLAANRVDTRVAESDIAELPEDNLVHRVREQLSADDSPEAAAALQMLYRFLMEGPADDH